jgi:hypothetical protein
MGWKQKPSSLVAMRFLAAAAGILTLVVLFLPLHV